jgi:uncharacterized protein YndB with AHSA1/START domain
MGSSSGQGEKGKFDEIPDFDLKVSEGAEETVVEVRIPRPAERCYQLFSDASHLSKWLLVVGTVVVRKRDEQGRGLEVAFMGSLQRASIGYTLIYEYDDSLREVRWRDQGGTIKRLAGSARFTPDGEERCVLRYTLASELPKQLPPWADELYRKRPAETVVLDFCEWVHGYNA